jgi:hypothetical protein
VLRQEKINKLERAQTDDELVYAVRDTDIGFALKLFSRVIRLHALTDVAAGGEKNEALNVYTKLLSWGAFSPGHVQVTSLMDKEFNAHLLSAGANRLSAEDEDPDSDAQKRLKNFLEDIREEGRDEKRSDEMAKWLEDSVPLVVNLTKMGGCEEEIRQVLQENPVGAAIIPQAMEAMLDLDRREEDLHIETLIKVYRVFLGGHSEDEDEMEAVVKRVILEIQDLAQPFLRKDVMIPEMMVTKASEGQKSNVIVFASSEVGQFLANNLSEDLQMFDSNGQQIARQSPPATRR